MREGYRDSIRVVKARENNFSGKASIVFDEVGPRAGVHGGGVVFA